MTRRRPYRHLALLPVLAALAVPGVRTVHTPAAAALLSAAASTRIAATTSASRPAGRLASPAAAAISDHAVATTTVVAGLACQRISGLRICTHGDDAAIRPSTANGETNGGSEPTSSTKVGCYGTGTSGDRIVTAYVRAVGTTDRYPEFVARFRGWAGAVEKEIDDSAHQTRGARHLRFETTAGPNCTLSILRLTLPSSAFTSFTSTIQALQQRGFDRAGSKYLLWTDATGYCGVASMYDDDTAGAGNMNNGSLPTYARVDRACWGYAEGHEIMHMLGGVSAHAPHATAGFHCNDGADIMCYDDGSARSTQHQSCPAAHARLFDCNSDDYFSTAPPAGSWLSGHWNVAFSSFLSPAWSESAPTASPTPTADPANTDAEQPAPTEQPTPLVSLPPLARLGR